VAARGLGLTRRAYAAETRIVGCGGDK